MAHERIVVSKRGGTLDLVDHADVDPAPRHVRIASQACGISRTDASFVNRYLPGPQFLLTG